MSKTFALVKGSDEKGLVQPVVVAMLDKEILASLATTNLDSSSYISTCYFAADKDWNLYFLSSPKSNHARNLVRQPVCAVNLYDSEQPFGTELQGMQLFGVAKQLSPMESVHAFSVYTKKFPELVRYAADLQNLYKHINDRFFEFAITGGKLLSEPTFGKEVYIDFRVGM